MTNRSTQIHAKGKHSEMVVRQHSTDSPLLPVLDLEKLHQFRPDLVDFVIRQTQIEADDRRAKEKTINRLIFVERMTGLLFSLIMGAGGILGGIYAGVNGQPWLGGVIASATIGTLAVAFIYGNKKPH